MNTPQPMNTPHACPNLTPEDLVAHLDGELGAADTNRVAAHLSACAACRAEAALLARAGDAVAALPSLEPSRAFATRVLRAARAAPQEASPVSAGAVSKGAAGGAPARRGRLIRPWSVAAAAAAALVLSFVFPRLGKTPDPSESEVAHVLTAEELQAIAEDLPLLANLQALEDLNGKGDPNELIALIEDLDLLESVETESLDALEALLDEEEGG